MQMVSQGTKSMTRTKLDRWSRPTKVSKRETKRCKGTYARREKKGSRVLLRTVYVYTKLYM